jgi:hypothetical protein
MSALTERQRSREVRERACRHPLGAFPWGYPMTMNGFVIHGIGKGGVIEKPLISFML